MASGEHLQALQSVQVLFLPQETEAPMLQDEATKHAAAQRRSVVMFFMTQEF